MLTRIKQGIVLLVALPAAALAEPITIVTHSTGMTDYYSLSTPTPYELTITAIYESTSPIEYSTTPFGVEQRLVSRNTPYVLEYKNKYETFRRSGIGLAELFGLIPGTPDGNEYFGQRISIDLGGEDSVSYQQRGWGPVGGFGEGGLLATRHIDVSAGLRSDIHRAAYSSGPGIDQLFSTDAPSTFSLHVSPFRSLLPTRCWVEDWAFSG